MAASDPDRHLATRAREVDSRPVASPILHHVERRPMRRYRNRSPWRPVILPLGLLFTLAVVGMAALGVRAYLFKDEALPGVRVLGTDLTGQSQERAAATLRRAVQPRLTRVVAVEVGRRTVELSPSWLLALNESATAKRALHASRGSVNEQIVSLLPRMAERRDVTPVFRVRSEAASVLAQLRRYARRPVSATVAISGLEPVVRPARAGQRLDEPALLEALKRAVIRPGTPVAARFLPAPAPVSTVAARAAAARARSLLAAPVTLRYDGQTAGRVEREQLAEALRLEPKGRAFNVRFDPAPLRRAVEPAAGRWLRSPTSARFEVGGSGVSIVPSVSGRGLDSEATASAVMRAASSGGERSAPLTLRSVPAGLTTGEAEKLGIRERVSSFTTEMGVSSSNRIHNVQLMARYIDGTVIEPGATFSFNRTVGPRTVERGFREGSMIVGTLLLPSIGGGVCQTATTLFNNAFELGLPIVERQNHSFYISHYPLGRDATVSWGGPDFVFRNDLPTGLLIKTSYTSSTLTFTFYGTPSGRRVVSSTGPQTSWRQPATAYALDPSAPPGSVRTENGSNQPGFDVAVHRTVYGKYGVIGRDSFSSSYTAVGPTRIYGPGQTVPRPYFVLPAT